MPPSLACAMQLDADQCQRAASARDARFDGLFYIGVLTTRIYCRPICPARVSTGRRRFFVSAAAAERAGFRPCLRCRPELAPGRARVDAVSRLAFVAAARIGAGALNGRSVAELARDLAVSERHLRRVLQREAGVSPLELAQTHRLLLAKRLLTDTALPVTDVAFASGFQSLRRFNTAFRERYRLSPTRLRRTRHADGLEAAPAASTMAPAGDVVHLSLAYRPPLSWDTLLACLEREALPGVELVDGRRYGRTVRIDGRSGLVFVAHAAADGRATPRATGPHLDVVASLSLLPVVMPLLARLRQLFDLDAEPLAIDAHLERAGLAPLVARRPGLRLPGALEPFEVALGTLIRGAGPPTPASRAVARRVVRALGEPLEGGVPGLDRLAPTADRVAGAGPARLAALGLTPRRALALDRVARAVAAGELALEPGGDFVAAHRALVAIAGIGEGIATKIVMRALYWPDAFAAFDRALQRTAGARGPGTLRRLAERWRPWRAYAALHLQLTQV